ncbi:MAG TPA: pyrroloquinoline quinone biosynthesis protein PqqE [Polyangiales bacterium]|nr:pyrroloquinoline quinone biosynthesis protein PqqE [Polyangiales bacterium]
MTDRPYTLVAELTYRCPLRCVYCSNPVSYADKGAELGTAAWQRVFAEAEALGAMQVHLTGGEPLLRRDLETLVASARSTGLYTSLITSATPLSRERLEALAGAGLEHVQISIQGLHDADAKRIAGGSWLQAKLQAARWVRELGLPLTINVVLHRENIEQVPELVQLALELGAERLELANTQYLGWALENRAALLPTAAQIAAARQAAERAREQHRGRMEILFVLPDYHAEVVRPCMQGWGRRYIVVSPDGLVLPCHQAHTLPGLHWERAGERPLAEIWQASEALNAFRGEAWMEEPCRSCEQRTKDFGGCRCQAYALTHRLTATDPACKLSPDHALITEARLRPAALVPLRYRRAP